MMKNTLKTTVSVIMMILLIITAISCSAQKDLWEDATYTENKTFGSGEKTITVEVKVDEHLVTFTVKTDQDTVGAALLEHKLIAGEDSQYGLFVKTVNGMTLDPDDQNSYWAFYVDGDYAMSGVDSTEIDENVTYQLAYTKG